MPAYSEHCTFVFHISLFAISDDGGDDDFHSFDVLFLFEKEQWNPGLVTNKVRRKKKKISII